MDTAGFTISDIGFMAAFYSLVQLLAEVPTGYFADRIGRIKSIRIGAGLAALATIFYVIFHSKVGIFAGVFLEALGYSFMGGAGEALIHDSLVVKKQEHLYTKVLSKAQSASLIANAILLALVPMTYAVDARLPFILGTVAYLSLLGAALVMQDLAGATSKEKMSLPDFSQIASRRNILIFALSFGIISALYTSSTDMFNVAIKTYGIKPEYLGWIYGLSSILGALIGPYIHHLQGIHLSRYILLDLAMLLSLYIAAYTGSPILLSLTVIVAVSFWRYRKIIYQSYLLTNYPTSLKATLLSAMSNLEQLNSIWLPLAIAFVIHQTNLPIGLGIVGLFALAIAPIFYFSTQKFFKRDPLPKKLVNVATDTV
jgi:MFS family permease